ncbi:27540_t:CDS:2, partial [Racocetra persica]
MKNIKELFDKDDRISFPPGILMKGSFKDGKYYIRKPYKRSNCKVYTIECCRQSRKELLEEEGSDLFVFGKYRLLLGSSDEIVDAINN